MQMDNNTLFYHESYIPPVATSYKHCFIESLQIQGIIIFGLYLIYMFQYKNQVVETRSFQSLSNIG